MRFAVLAARLSSLLLLPAAFALGVSPAAAQLSGASSMPSISSPSSMAGPPPLIGGQTPPSVKKPEQAPDALPGAASRQDRVAPSSGTQFADPTDALFDAINRGDIASARDAIDRGADLGGHNVLGMTPLDLAVDLGRNDITFLLLSLRNAASSPRSASTSQTARGPAPADNKVAMTKPTKPPAKAPVRPPVAARPAAAQIAQQAAGDGGTPDPAAGFLGFGPSR